MFLLFLLAVCDSVLTRFAATLTDEVKADPKLIEIEFKSFCLTAKNKDERFVCISKCAHMWLIKKCKSLIVLLFDALQCYYLGGRETSATGMLGEMSKPMSWGMPTIKICEKLKKKDAQICDLRYGMYDWSDAILCIMIQQVTNCTQKWINESMCSFLYWNCIYFLDFTEKQIDLSAVDLKKLKVRDLKKILNDWDENCDGCIEKTDYIRRIEELKPKYYKEGASAKKADDEL